MGACVPVSDWLVRLAANLERCCKAALCVAFALMLAVGALQIAARYLFGTSLSWSEELLRYLHIWLVFLAIPLAYRYQRHISLNLLRERLGPTFDGVMQRVVDLLWLSVFGATCWFTVRLMSVAKFQITPGLGVRMDVVYAGILLGSLILLIFALAELIGERAEAGSES